MKKHATNLILIGAVFIFAYWILTGDHSGAATRLLSTVLEPARSFYDGRPVAAILIFCAAHMLASLFSLPGSCTSLNTVSGAVFGFWLGCAIVYPITLVSACLMYFIASHLHDHKFFKRYPAQMEMLRKHLREKDYLFFVALRLSPFLPFGIINAIQGLLRVPFGLYFLTTFVGIFFDVVLLNSLGAGLGGVETGSPQGKKTLALAFVALFLVFFLLRLLVPKAYDQTLRRERKP